MLVVIIHALLKEKGYDGIAALRTLVSYECTKVSPSRPKKEEGTMLFAVAVVPKTVRRKREDVDDDQNDCDVYLTMMQKAFIVDANSWHFDWMIRQNLQLCQTDQ